MHIASVGPGELAPGPFPRYAPLVGPQDPSPQDVTRDVTRDLSALVGELAALKGDATHWLTGPEYAALRHCLEGARRGGGAHRGQA